MYGLFGQQSPFGQQPPFAENQLQPPDPRQMVGQYMPAQHGLFGSQAPAAPTTPAIAPQAPPQGGQPTGDGLGYVRDAMGDYANLLPQPGHGGGGMGGGMGGMKLSPQMLQQFAQYLGG